ncbi:HAD family hydrolase [uncultured Phycicoccus sp.]|uniref:HAD family hydrolase n=1 Tax=uncultured Phycicoccus sp. TaxID=661422 RepID=UPI0026072D56|nr:HAD family hydrolase [uncultured Phycicoccus sp.]
MTRPVVAVLLDADDTLYDTRAAMHAAGAVAAAAAWPGADPRRLALAGVRFRDDPADHFGAYTRGEIEFEEMRRRRVADLAAWLGEETAGRSGAFDERYEPAFISALRAFPDVRPEVERLRSAGVVVGVLTNSSTRYTDAKMRAAGLVGLFDVVCTRDTLGVGKPDARAFHEACRRLGADPGATLHVGDEVVNDPLGARDAGLAAAWLVRDGRPDDGGLRLLAGRDVPVVTSLADLATLVPGGPPRFGVDEVGR